MSRESLTIGQVASSLGVNVETIRYYQRLGLMGAPERPLGTIRRYDEAFVQRMRFIKRSKQVGFSLCDIKGLLLLEDGNDCVGARRIAEQKLSDIESRLLELQAMKTRLATLLEGCQSPTASVRCSLIASLANRAPS